MKNVDENLSSAETFSSPSRRRRFLSGNHLSPHTVESGNVDYQLRRNSTMQQQTNIRNRSGSFNPTILTQHKLGKNFIVQMFHLILDQFISR